MARFTQAARDSLARDPATARDALADITNELLALQQDASKLRQLMDRVSIDPQDDDD